MNTQLIITLAVLVFMAVSFMVRKSIIRSDWHDLHARTGSDRSHRFKHGVFRFFQ